MFKLSEQTKEGLKSKARIGVAVVLGLTGVGLLIWGLKSGNTPTIDHLENNHTSDELAERRVA